MVTISKIRKSIAAAVATLSLLANLSAGRQCFADTYVFSYIYNVTTSTAPPLGCEGALWFEVGVSWALGGDCPVPHMPIGIVRGFCYQAPDNNAFFPTFSNVFDIEAVSWEPDYTC